ncbi:MAG: methyltransferase domain-containing protein [Chloroflexota bacterium]
MSKETIRQQFGANAKTYVTSKPHAKGASLQRLVETVQPQPDWHVLDLATAAGHTALAFAPFVDRVIGLDLTPQMLPLAADLAAERGIENLDVLAGDVDDLPFDDGQFDLVTCRIAPHHFDDIGRFLAETARVLKPGGVFGLVDNVVPGSRLRGKKADQQRLAGRYVNAFEKLRDPSHGRCLSMNEWQDALVAAGFDILHEETLDKEMQFESWAARHPADTRLRLKAALLQAPEAAADFLNPQVAGDLTSFRLREGLFVTRHG